MGISGGVSHPLDARGWVRIQVSPEPLCHELGVTAFACKGAPVRRPFFGSMSPDPASQKSTSIGSMICGHLTGFPQSAGPEEKLGEWAENVPKMSASVEVGGKYALISRSEFGLTRRQTSPWLLV